MTFVSGGCVRPDRVVEEDVGVSPGERVGLASGRQGGQGGGHARRLGVQARNVVGGVTLEARESGTGTRGD